MSTQYHVLVVGFELEKRSAGGDSRKTELRHYRYDTSVYALTNENGAVIIRNGKTYVAQFPVGFTMVLVEEIDDHK